MDGEMEDAEWKRRDPGKNFSAEDQRVRQKVITIKADMRAAVKKEVEEALVKYDREVLTRINTELSSTAKNILDDKNIDTQRGLLLMTYQNMLSQIERYRAKIAKEEKKRSPRLSLVAQLDSKIDRLLICMPAELRKLNEGQHTMRFGKRNVNINATVPQKKVSIEDLKKKPDVNLSDEDPEDVKEAEIVDENKNNEGKQDTAGDKTGN
jgi:hypothetical protein